MARRKQKTGSQAGRLRIVAGIWRSRLLEIADVTGLRPTSERVRETLFNWLAPYLPGAHCLDLYAGTGALGLEALSRGAGRVVFVENHPAASRRLARNIGMLGAENAELVERDAMAYLRGAPSQTFDIVFLDPPFAADLLTETCRLLAATNRLADRALVYLEMGRAQALPAFPDAWRVTRDRTAGNVRYLLVETGS